VKSSIKKTKPFATEADLCARFIAAIGEDWVAYNEHAGWDTLLVRKADGFQIGIEAKLRLGTDVINQALEEYGSYDADRMGPDCRAVLVPSDQSNAFDRICAYIGLTIITVWPAGEVSSWRRHVPVFEPDLPLLVEDWRANAKHWYEWAPKHRHRLPEYVPDVVAGSPSPVQLTDWKISAIKIAVILEKRGFLTRADFAHIKIDHRRWLPSGNNWLKLDGGVYRRGSWFPDFKAQHPRVYDEIAADYDTWKPDIEPLPPLPLPIQEPLL
jgi:hypothetical protein